MCSLYLMSDSTAANLAKSGSTTTHDALVYGYTHSHRWVTMDYADQRLEMPKTLSILPSCTDTQAHPLECCQSVPQTRSYSSDSLDQYCRAQFVSFKHRQSLNGINKCIPERHDVHQDTCSTSVLEAGDERLKELARKNVNLKKQDSYRHDDLQSGDLVSSSGKSTPQGMDKTCDSTSMVTISSRLAVPDVRRTNSQHLSPKSSLIHTKSFHDIRLEGQVKDLLGLSRAYSSLRSNALGVPKYKPNKNGIIIQKRRTLSPSSVRPLEYQSLFGVSEFLQQQQRQQQPPQQQQQQQRQPQHDACQAFLASLAVLRVSFNSELTAGQGKTSREFMNSQERERRNVCERIIPVKTKTTSGGVELQNMSLARFPYQFDVANSGIGRVSNRIEHSQLEMTNGYIGVPMSDSNYQTASVLPECDKHETAHNSLSDVVEASNQSENASAQKHKNQNISSSSTIDSEMEENSSRTTTGTQCSDSNDSASENRTKIVSCLLKSSASNGKRKSCQVSFDLLRNQCIKYNRFGTLIEPGTRILGYISSCGVAPGEDPNYKRSIHLLPSKQASEYFTPVRARRPSSFTFLISRPTDTDGSVSPRMHSQVLTGYSSCLYPTQFAAHRVQFSGHISNPFFRHSAHCNGNVTLSKPRNVLPTESSQRCHTGKIKLAGRSMPAERLAQSNPCQACMHTVQ